jgi:hypothetical protein
MLLLQVEFPHRIHGVTDTRDFARKMKEVADQI